VKKGPNTGGGVRSGGGSWRLLAATGLVLAAPRALAQEATSPRAAAGDARIGAALAALRTEVVDDAAAAARAARLDDAIDALADEASFWKRRELTGDWGGARSRLADAGFTFRFEATLDPAWNLGGGVDSGGTAAMVFLAAGVDVDLEKVVGADGLVLSTEFQPLRGTPLADLIGPVYGVDVWDAPHRAQLAEVFLDWTASDRWRFKLGKFDANDDFALPDRGAAFLHVDVTSDPTQLAFPTYPDPAFGAAAFWTPDDVVTVGVAAMDGALAQGVSTGARGPRTLFGPPSDAWFAAQVDARFGAAANRVGVGVWAHTGDFARFDGGVDDGAWGQWLLLERTLWRESRDDPEDAQGVGAFLRYGHADADVSAVEHFVRVGVEWTGALEGRDDDVIGLGAAWNRTTDDPGAGFDRDAEWSFEAFYRCQVAGWMYVQPDLMYFVDPGATSASSDAWLLTLRIGLVF